MLDLGANLGNVRNGFEVFESFQLVGFQGLNLDRIGLWNDSLQGGDNFIVVHRNQQGDDLLGQILVELGPSEQIERRPFDRYAQGRLEFGFEGGHGALLPFAQLVLRLGQSQPIFPHLRLFGLHLLAFLGGAHFLGIHRQQVEAQLFQAEHLQRGRFSQVVEPSDFVDQYSGLIVQHSPPQAVSLDGGQVFNLGLGIPEDFILDFGGDFPAFGQFGAHFRELGAQRFHLFVLQAGIVIVDGRKSFRRGQTPGFGGFLVDQAQFVGDDDFLGNDLAFLDIFRHQGREQVQVRCDHHRDHHRQANQKAHLE